MDERLYNPSFPRKDCDPYRDDEDCSGKDWIYVNTESTENCSEKCTKKCLKKCPKKRAPDKKLNYYSITPGSHDLALNQSRTNAQPFRITDFPWQLKCSKFDFRPWHGCISVSYFQPSTRVYLDSGKDDVDEIDIFNDGSMNLALDFVTVHIPWRFGRSRYFDAWTLGPFVGAGIGQPPKDSADGTVDASNAPVALFSAGLLFQYKLDSASFGLELGGIRGYSSDENFADTTDSAAFLGIKISIPTSK